MSVFLVLLLLLPSVIGLCLLLRCGPEEGLLLTLFVLIAAVYFLGIFGLLPVAAPLFWMGNLAVIAAVVTALVKKREQRSHFVSILPTLLLLGGLGLLLWWVCRGCAFTDWDDFSHWGKSIKFMFYSDKLYTVPSSPDGFKSYPPATAVLEYLFLKAGRFSFREDIVLYVNALLAGGTLLLPLRALRGKKQPAEAGVLMAALLVVIFSVFPSFFFRAGVDGLLGLITGSVLMSEFLPQRTRATGWLTSLGCFALALLKTSGTGLALVAALVIFAHRLAGTGEIKKPLRALLPRAVCPLLMVATAKISWSLHLSLVGAAERWQSSENMATGLFQLMTGTAPGYRSTVLQRFKSAVFSEKSYGWLLRFPFWGWLLFFAVLAVLAFLVCPRQGDALQEKLTKRSVLWLTGAVLGTALVFTVSLLCSYLFIFSESEALQLASVYRYLDTITLMLLYCGTSLVFAAVSEIKFTKRWGLLAVSAGLCLLLCDPRAAVTEVIGAPIHAAQTNHDRYLARHAAERINALGETDPRLYLITANDAGISQMQTEYELLPQQLPAHSSILMERQPKNEPWVRACSPEEWSKELAAGYDYVYIFCPEDQFVREYLELFEDESQVVVDRMFRVILQEDGTARLRCLD